MSSVSADKAFRDLEARVARLEQMFEPNAKPKSPTSDDPRAFEPEAVDNDDAPPVQFD